MYEEVASFPILDSVRATSLKCEFLAALCAYDLFVSLNILRIFNQFNFKNKLYSILFAFNPWNTPSEASFIIVRM